MKNTAKKIGSTKLKNFFSKIKSIYDEITFQNHREVWDDIPDKEFQEYLNILRKEKGLKEKDIDLRTGRIK